MNSAHGQRSRCRHIRLWLESEEVLSKKAKFGRKRHAWICRSFAVTRRRESINFGRGLDLIHAVHK